MASNRQITKAVDSALAALEEVGAGELSIVNDPAATDTAGRALAAAVSEEAGAADVLAAWDDPGSAVLAHVVAREMGIRVVRASDVEGILELDTHLPAGKTVVLLADVFRSEGALTGLASLVLHRGGRVIAVAALYGTPSLDVSPTHAARVTLRSGRAAA